MPHNKTKLEDICVSLELAKQLKKAEYPQESLFYWQDDEILINPFDSPRDLRKWLSDYGHPISAPTASEIGEKLPEKIWFGEVGCGGKDYFFKQEYGNRIGYWASSGKSLGESFEDRNEATRRAKMWLYLKKEGLL